MINKTSYKRAIMLAFSITAVTASTTIYAFNMGNMMNPSKWFGGKKDRGDYYDDYGYGAPGYGGYGGPGYGYGAPGYGGGPGYGYGAPGYGYGAPGYGYGDRGYGYGAPGYGAPGYGYGAPGQSGYTAPPPR